MAYGRPMKGKSRRVPITVHSSVGLLDTIDEYVEERDQAETGAYSRSDFFNEAVLFYLKHLGKDPDEEELRNERTKNVPEKNTERARHENTENAHNRNE